MAKLAWWKNRLTAVTASILGSAFVFFGINQFLPAVNVPYITDVLSAGGIYAGAALLLLGVATFLFNAYAARRRAEFIKGGESESAMQYSKKWYNEGAVILFLSILAATFSTTYVFKYLIAGNLLGMGIALALTAITIAIGVYFGGAQLINQELLILDRESEKDPQQSKTLGTSPQSNLVAPKPTMQASTSRALDAKGANSSAPKFDAQFAAFVATQTGHTSEAKGFVEHHNHLKSLPRAATQNLDNALDKVVFALRFTISYPTDPPSIKAAALLLQGPNRSEIFATDDSAQQINLLKAYIERRTKNDTADQRPELPYLAMCLCDDDPQYVRKVMIDCWGSNLKPEFIKEQARIAEMLGATSVATYLKGVLESASMSSPAQMAQKLGGGKNDDEKSPPPAAAARSEYKAPAKDYVALNKAAIAEINSIEDALPTPAKTRWDAIKEFKAEDLAKESTTTELLDFAKVQNAGRAVRMIRRQQIKWEIEALLAEYDVVDEDYPNLDKVRAADADLNPTEMLAAKGDMLDQNLLTIAVHLPDGNKIVHQVVEELDVTPTKYHIDHAMPDRWDKDIKSYLRRAKAKKEGKMEPPTPPTAAPSSSPSPKTD